MRASVLLWSTFSGLLLGLFIDATLIGVAALLFSFAPTGLGARLHGRWLTAAAAAVLVAIPAVLTVLGYLEGRLKTL